MRMKTLTLLLIITLIITSLTSNSLTTKPSPKLNVNIIFHVKDYVTDRPIANYTLSASIQLNLRYPRTLKVIKVNGTLNMTGFIEYNVTLYAGRIVGGSLTYLRISCQNKTPLAIIKINDYTVSDLILEHPYGKFLYLENSTIIQKVPIPIKVVRLSASNYTILCNIYVLQGKLVNITDYDPLIKTKIKLLVAPGFLASEYEYNTCYLLPLNYTIVIKSAEDLIPERYTVIRTWVSNETNRISWTYYFARDWLLAEFRSLEQTAEWFNSFGYPVVRNETLELLNYLINSSLSYFKEGNISEALGALNVFCSKLSEVHREIASVKLIAMPIAVIMFLLLLGFSVVVSTLIVKEKKVKEITKFVLFVSLSIVLILTQTSTKIAMALFLSSIGIPISKFDYVTLTIGTIVFLSLIFVIFQFINYLAKSEKRISVSIAIQYLKSRKWLTLLTVITMIIVIASSIVVIKITQTSYLNQEVISLPTNNVSGVFIRLNPLLLKGLNDYEVSWIVSILPNGTLYKLVTLLPASELTSEGSATPIGYAIESTGGSIETDIQIIIVNKTFLTSILNFEKCLIEGTLISDVEYTAILPSSFSNVIHIGDQITIYVCGIDAQGTLTILNNVTPPLTVVGFYDESLVSNLTLYDGMPFVSDPSCTILVSPSVLSEIKNETLCYGLLLITNKTITPQIPQKLATLFPSRIAIVNGTNSIVYEKVSLFLMRGFEFTVVLLVMTSLMIFILISNFAKERERDLRTLAILGAPPTSVSFVLLNEGLLIGFISSICAWLISPGIALFIEYICKLWGYEVTLELSPLHVPPLETAYIALFLGIMTSFVASLIPAIRIQKITLMGRRKVKVISDEDLRVKGDLAIYTLPLRVTIFEADLLYRFLKTEVISKRDFISEEIHLDGSFSMKFSITSPKGDLIYVTLRTVKHEDIFTLELCIPAHLREYIFLSPTVRNLEKKILKYTEWKNKQLRYIILRRRPPRRPFMLDELLEEADRVLVKIKDDTLRLKKLEKLKPRIPSKLYDEYKRKYERLLREHLRELSNIALRLDNFYKQLKKEVEKLSFELEKLRLAYELREISEVDFKRKEKELSERLNNFRQKLNKIEEVYTLLRKRRTSLSV